MTRFARCRWAALLLTCVCVLAFASAAKAAEGDERTRRKEHFMKAMVAFDEGRYKVAAKEFEEVLKVEPNSSEALELRDLADARFFIQVLSRGTPQMREQVLKLLAVASEAEKRRLTDQGRIAKLITSLASDDFEVRYTAYSGLIGAGRYAVPGLIQRLADTKARDYETYRVRATVALVRIGEEAVLPLCTALRADNATLRQDVCFILGQSGDPRAVPYLLRHAKTDPRQSVREVATRALTKISEYVDVPDDSADVALFRYARLYYYRDPSVQRPAKFGHTVWNWSTRKKALAMQTVPSFLYNVSMARDVATEALLSNPKYEPALPLLISTYHKEILLISRRLELSEAGESGKLSELDQRQLRARLARSKNVLLTLRSAGEKHFYRALSMQLRDREPELATAVIEDLALVASPELKVQPDPAELSAPIRPAVTRTRPPRKEKPSAATPQPGKPTPTTAPKVQVTPTHTPPPITVDAMRLFGLAVETETKRTKDAASKAAKAKQPGAADQPATPKDQRTLVELIATASADLRQVTRQRAAVEADTTKEHQPPTLEGNPLILALQAADKGVRYAAAAALARISPTHAFAASKAVVEILGQAITEKGVSTVLIVTADNQAANRLRVIVRDAGQVPFSAGSTAAAVAAARALPPKDIILLQDNMKEAFQTLQKDPAVGGVPVIVFTADRDPAGVAQDFAGAASVISLKASPDAIKAELAKVILGRRTRIEGLRLSAQYARVAARALVSIPATGSPFSPHLSGIQEALVAALNAEDPEVRISAIGALGRAKATSLVPRLIDMCQAADRTQPERRACIEAIGQMIEPGKKTPPAVIDLLRKIHNSGDDKLRTFAVHRLFRAPIPPADLERLITEQEAAQPSAPPAPNRAP